MSLFAASRHPGDEDLIRYMDHQLDREAHRIMGAHLRTCAECTARLEAYQQKNAVVKEWLSLLPAAMPDDGKRAVALAAVDRARFRRRRMAPLTSPSLRAAAAVLLLLGVGLGTEPGRAFVAGGVVRLAGREPGPLATRLVEWLGEERVLPAETPTLAQAPQPVMAAPPSTDAATRTAPEVTRSASRAAEAPPIKPGMSAPVTFTPRGPDVTLVFHSVQAFGGATLHFRRTAPRASGQVWAHYRGEGLIPTADGLEIRNTPESRADYMIVIPSRYRMIRVRVADGPEVRVAISKSKQEWIWTIPLQLSVLEDQ
ncbi:MAG TPA: hypothetical protein VF092_23950 [Longimicrobium sp.]